MKTINKKIIIKSRKNIIDLFLIEINKIEKTLQTIFENSLKIFFLILQTLH